MHSMFFGVRHLSPSGAWHLRRFLDKVRPKVDCSSRGSTMPKSRSSPTSRARGRSPPIAILAYTPIRSRVRTLVYPVARYSPEYQALKWAICDEHDALGRVHRSAVRHFSRSARRRGGAHGAAAEKGGGGRRRGRRYGGGQKTPSLSKSLWRPERDESIYQRIAARCGEPDYDTYWERRFEHNLEDDSYRLAAFELGKALRDEDDPPVQACRESRPREPTCAPHRRSHRRRCPSPSRSSPSSRRAFSLPRC